MFGAKRVMWCPVGITRNLISRTDPNRKTGMDRHFGGKTTKMENFKWTNFSHGHTTRNIERTEFLRKNKQIFLFFPHFFWILTIFWRLCSKSHFAGNDVVMLPPPYPFLLTSKAQTLWGFWSVPRMGAVMGLGVVWCWGWLPPPPPPPKKVDRRVS